MVNHSKLRELDATEGQGWLLTQLQDRYGPVIGGQDLRQALGFPSAAAFRQAALRGTLPVPVFSVPNRRGRFALTQEVAAWLYERRCTATTPGRDSSPPTAGGIAS
ncbi:hypothetical protein NOX35_27165 (plasmid) [Comamonas sp. C11]|nr:MULTISPECIES: hypothetical protein [Comamonas]UUC96593.1 hypothetical protein NOX35_27165 [Comamonas sp. C11]